MSDHTVRILNVRGLLFERDEDGSVTIDIPAYDTDCPGALIQYTADEWASIIGFVSAIDDKKLAYKMAREFHEKGHE